MAPEDFCQALRTYDGATLKALIDVEFATLDAETDDEAKFLAFKEWLGAHDCVTSVEIGRGVLRSDPPIKEFHVTVRITPEDTAQRDLGIRLSPTRYEFDLK